MTSPKLEWVAAEADALGADQWRVRLVVQNTGWLPSYVSKRALERKIVRGTKGDRIDLVARHERAGTIWASVTLG